MTNKFSINKDWTAEEFETAHSMASKGISAREIGVVLGRTKNSVIGVLHRSGFVWGVRRSLTFKEIKGPPNRKRERPRNSMGRYKRLRDEQPAAPTFIEPEGAKNDAISFYDLKREHCKAIYGHPQGVNTLYCGAQKLAESSYCKYHHLRYYKKAS